MMKFLIVALLLSPFLAFAAQECQCPECKKKPVIENPDCPYCGEEIYLWCCPQGHGQSTNPGPDQDHN